MCVCECWKLKCGEIRLRYNLVEISQVFHIELLQKYHRRRLHPEKKISLRDDCWMVARVVVKINQKTTLDISAWLPLTPELCCRWFLRKHQGEGKSYRIKSFPSFLSALRRLRKSRDRWMRVGWNLTIPSSHPCCCSQVIPKWMRWIGGERKLFYLSLSLESWCCYIRRINFLLLCMCRLSFSWDSLLSYVMK